MDLPYNQVIGDLGNFPREIKIYFHIGSCIWMSIVTLFVTTKQNKTTHNVGGMSKEYRSQWKELPMAIAIIICSTK